MDSAVESVSFIEAVETKVIAITGQHWRLFVVAVLLVSVPVFVQLVGNIGVVGTIQSPIVSA